MAYGENRRASRSVHRRLYCRGVRFHTYAIGMLSRFRGIDRREGMLVEGPAGWAEFSPFLDYEVPDCVPWLRCALESASQPWPEPLRDRVPVNCTVPVVPPETAHRIVTESGCQTAKVKVGGPDTNPADDEGRLEAVRDALGPAGRIRIDVNGLWGVDEAVRLLARFEKAANELEYVEQPCATLDELAALRRKVDVPVAADESIRRADDPLRAARMEAADIAVLKVQPLGGIQSCLRIAEQIGLPVVVSSAVETSVGLAVGVALAAALPELPYACGLATTSLLAGDVVAEPLRPHHGAVPVGRIAPDSAQQAAAADADTEMRWQQRLAAVREEMARV